jgi:hypothetical protein
MRVIPQAGYEYLCIQRMNVKVILTKLPKRVPKTHSVITPISLLHADYSLKKTVLCFTTIYFMV